MVVASVAVDELDELLQMRFGLQIDDNVAAPQTMPIRDAGAAGCFSMTAIRSMMSTSPRIPPRRSALQPSCWSTRDVALVAAADWASK